MTSFEPSSQRELLPQPVNQGNAEDPVRADAQSLYDALTEAGFRTKASLRGLVLTLMVEAEQVPPADQVVAIAQAQLAALPHTALSAVHLRARQQNATAPAWSRALTVAQQARPSQPMQHPSSTYDRPKSITPARPAHYLNTQQIAIVTITSLLMMFVGANLRTVSDYSRRQFFSTATLAPSSLSAGGTFVAPVVERVAGIPIIDVTFNNNQTVPMMIDTGASGTLITQPIARALRVESVAKVSTSTVNGTVVLDVGYVNSINVHGAEVINVPVAIALPNMSVGLLGHDFLQHFDVTLREDVVEFEPRQRR
ncbi:MAG: retroviral-like aspartic protease family protein [Kaiparowitsia implicata GSE-PSE-MK54-09C]|jgi:predicted aspartyl protease|nr:retroviral-like aspartic protease family protein [Kaiparowitsia implicata GSE-PSE-MK54-09C]